MELRQRRFWQVQKFSLYIFFLLSVTTFFASWCWLDFFYVFCFLFVFTELFFLMPWLFYLQIWFCFHPSLMRQVDFLIQKWLSCTFLVELFVIKLLSKSLSKLFLLIASNVLTSASLDGADSILLVGHWFCCLFNCSFDVSFSFCFLFGNSFQGFLSFILFSLFPLCGIFCGFWFAASAVQFSLNKSIFFKLIFDSRLCWFAFLFPIS